MLLLLFQKKISFVRSLFMTFAKWKSITFADIFTIFGEILSRPVAFLGSNPFIILFTSSVVVVGISKFSFCADLIHCFNTWGGSYNV